MSPMSSIPKPAQTHPFKRYAQILISIILIVIATSFINWPSFWAAISASNPVYYLLAIILVVLRNWGLAYRCQILLKAFGKYLPISFYVKWYFIAFFYNMFLPTTVGGDVIRGYSTAKQSIDIPKVASVLILERFLGLFAFAAIALVFYPASSYFHTELGKLSFYGLITLIAIMAVFYILCVYYSPRRSLPVDDKRGLIMRTIGRFSKTWQSLGNRYRHVMVAFMVSFLFQFFKILSVYCLSRGLHLQMSFLDCAFIFPIIEIISMLPLSFNGIGLREVSFLYYLKPLGITQTNAFLLSILVTSLLVVLGFIGFLIHMGSKLLTFKEDSR